MGGCGLCPSALTVPCAHRLGHGCGGGPQWQDLHSDQQGGVPCHQGGQRGRGHLHSGPRVPAELGEVNHAEAASPLYVGGTFGGMEVQQTAHGWPGVFRDTQPSWSCQTHGTVTLPLHGDTSLHTPSASHSCPYLLLVSISQRLVPAPCLHHFPHPVPISLSFPVPCGGDGVRERAPPECCPTPGCCHPSALHTQNWPRGGIWGSRGGIVGSRGGFWGSRGRIWHARCRFWGTRAEILQCQGRIWGARGRIWNARCRIWGARAEILGC